MAIQSGYRLISQLISGQPVQVLSPISGITSLPWKQSVLDIDTLKSITSSEIVNGDTCFVEVNGAVYTYSTTSLATPDNIGVLLPNNVTLTTPGRWVLTKSYLNTNSILEGNKLFYTDTRVRGVQLVGLTLSNAPITAKDTLVSALGKVQGQINSISGATSTAPLDFSSIKNTPTTISGYGITDAVSLAAYNAKIADLQSQIDALKGTPPVVITPAVTSVTLTPTTLATNPGLVSSLSASVVAVGNATTNLTWSATGGTISGSGSSVTYTAPSTVGTYTIKATSVFDSTKSAQCTVTVTAATTGTLTITPNAPTAVGNGGTIQFTASNSVTWAVDGITGGNSTVGIINTSGLYTCPAVSSTTLRTITATSVSDPSKKVSVRILNTVSNTVTTVSPSGTTGNTDTTNINNALAANLNGIVKLAPGTYSINPKLVNTRHGIYLNNGNTLLANGAVLNCQTQSGSSGYFMVAAATTNCALVGGVFNGDRIARNLPTYISDTGTDYEAGCGVIIANGSGAKVIGASFNNNCCDGIYIANAASNWIVSDCIADNNRRQGISPVDCNNGVIQYCSFTNTNGNDPAFGIDFEPNSGNTVTNILVDNCLITGNAGGGIAGGPAIKNGISGGNTAFCNHITVQNCTITGNGGSNYRGGGISWTQSTDITIKNNVINNNLDHGISARYIALNFIIDGNTVNSNANHGIELGDGFGTAGECAGTVVSNNTVKNNAQAPQIYSYPGCGATLTNNVTA